MLVAVAGMSHRSAPVEVRARRFPPCAGRNFLRRLKDEGVVSEAVLLSTCNRTEVYAVVEDEGRGAGARPARRRQGVERASLGQDTYWLTDAEGRAAPVQGRLFLDSMVGEGSDPRPGTRGVQGVHRGALRGPDPQPALHTSLGSARRSAPIRG